MFFDGSECSCRHLGHNYLIVFHQVFYKLFQKVFQKVFHSVFYKVFHSVFHRQCSTWCSNKCSLLWQFCQLLNVPHEKKHVEHFIEWNTWNIWNNTCSTAINTHVPLITYTRASEPLELMCPSTLLIARTQKLGQYEKIRRSSKISTCNFFHFRFYSKSLNSVFDLLTV